MPARSKNGGGGSSKGKTKKLSVDDVMRKVIHLGLALVQVRGKQGLAKGKYSVPLRQLFMGLFKEGWNRQVLVLSTKEYLGLLLQAGSRDLSHAYTYAYM